MSAWRPEGTLHTARLPAGCLQEASLPGCSPFCCLNLPEVDLLDAACLSVSSIADEVEQVLAAQQLAALASGEARELPSGGSLGSKAVALPLDGSLGQECHLQGGRGALNIRVLHALPRAAAHGLDHAASDAAVAPPAPAGVGASPSHRAAEGGQLARAPMDAVTSAAQVQQAARVVRGMHDELEEKAVQVSVQRAGGLGIKLAANLKPSKLLMHAR